MTLIEGVGDEVTNFFIVVGISLITWIAWCSTNISETPLIRAVLILQQNTRNRMADFRTNQTAGLANDNSELNSEGSSQESNNTNEAGNSCPDSSTNAAGSNVSTESTTNRETPATSGTAEASSIAENVPTSAETLVSSEERLIQAMDSSNNEDPRALLEVGVERFGSGTNSADSARNASVEQVDGNQDAPQSEDDKMSIKLKFINDEQKLVTASPKEILGDFKRRNFQMELESQNLVRLVFKGQILQPDSLTLERCGLYNNCVVHCLVHQPRVNTSQSTQDNTSPPLYFNPQNMPTGTGLSTAQQDWNLSKLFLGVLILILGLAWYTRFYYAQHYNFTSTIVLYALTIIFLVSVLSQFFPDEEGLRNIE